ncbi:PREDICTED: uncharacterized protein LOC104826952 [Tarenaya hassleriana]|uniref:uncharacterized protein LOC104826952 n=1 Tax=Tarenaya hassleriana TaxID=28532 RepID=UPI00053CA7BF|nr:PREDICTED: uncharacterized protein LOC104826952 [Tarenaya hassleriana]
MGAQAVVQQQRNWAVEALQRRLAAAKAQLLQEQKKNEKDKKETLDADFSSRADLQPSSSSTLPAKDAKEDDVAYARLSCPINENLLTTNITFSSAKGSITDKVLHDLLQSGDSARKYLQGSKNVKLDSWILLDNFVPSRASSSVSTKALQKNSKRSKRRMSMKQLKKSGALQLPKDMQKFDLFKPMHEMWEGYMTQLIKATGKNQLAQSLISADFHGAYVIVAECKIESFAGAHGIMVRETSETFGIITRDDKLRVVPKKASVFIVQIDCWKVTLHGDKLISRNPALQR